MTKLRVAMLTPLPPSRTGIADYASLVLPPLAEAMELTAFAPEHHEYAGTDARGARISRPFSEYHPAEYDATIYQLGNNPHHEVMYREAMLHPGVVVLHDLVLHHLIVEMTLARGNADGYVAALNDSHGEAGAAWAEGRTIGLHDEVGNFLFPASVALANRSRAVIVHNRYAADRLRSLGVSTPIHVVPHAHGARTAPGARATIRQRLGIGEDERVIGLFGFLTSAKRSGVVLGAFREARRVLPSLRLLVVGEPAPDIDVTALASDGVTFTGYAEEEEFAAYYSAVDRLVNLRYPSAGETSGTLIRAFEAGKPVAVSDYAQFAEFPDDCVAKIPFGASEVGDLARFFLADLDEQSIAAAQQRWLKGEAGMERVVQGYLAALEDTVGSPGSSVGRAVTRALPLFPRLTMVALDRQKRAVTLRNDGELALRARVYGQPGYRLIARVFDEAGLTIEDRWLELPGDVEPGASMVVDLPLRKSGPVAFYHALESIPMLEPEAFARAIL
jgi:glycosyltransferase involved in cell wall biosynthesis